MRTASRCRVLSVLAALSVGTHAVAQCNAWSSQFALPVHGGQGMDGIVYALRPWGGSLYAGGQFVSAGSIGGYSQPADHLARWNGASWSPVGVQDGAIYAIWAIANFNDGTGDALYVGGLFSKIGGVTTNSIAKWNGSSWSALDTGVFLDTVSSAAGEVHALTVYDDGTGPALVVGGKFRKVGSVAAHNIATWKGGAWHALPGGNSYFAGDRDPMVRALATFDPDGSGPLKADLYSAGIFDAVPGVPKANGIARWNGSAWSGLGNGLTIDGLNNDGDGNALLAVEPSAGSTLARGLYVGGYFYSAGTVTCNSVARWNGSQFFALGSGTAIGVIDPTGPQSIPGTVTALGVFSDGSGQGLYVGGHFFQAGLVSVAHIARWRGGAWTSVEDGVRETNYFDWVYALGVYDNPFGTGQRGLFAGGWFEYVNNPSQPLIESGFIGRWNGCP